MKFSILFILMSLSAGCAFSSHRRIEAKMDHKRNRASLKILRNIALKYPDVQVHLGHQRVGQKLSPYGAN